jgi:cytochrome c
MLRWVLALEKGKGGPTLSRGLTGSVTPPKDAKPGRLLVEALYTDAGAGNAGALSQKATVSLRSPRIEAESGIAEGPRILGGSKASGKKALGVINHGHTVRFENLNLNAIRSLIVRTASAGAGAHIEVRLDTPTGPLLGTVEAPVTGNWDEWKENQAPITPTPGRHTVFLVFVNPGKGGLLNLDWVEFRR